MGYYINVEPKVKVYVEDINENEDKTIVFLHGWPGSHELFEYQYNYLIEKGIRCIGIDQRGFGKSDRPTWGYDYDTLSDDVKSVVDQLCLENFVLLGHSTGGAIAVRYMSRHDGAGVDKLILCSAAVPSLIRRSYFPYGLKRKAVEEIINGTYNDRPKMLKNFGDIFFYNKPSKWFMEWFLNLGFQASSWATADIAKTWLDEEELFYDIMKIEAKTLILHGIHDEVCLFALAEAQKKHIKNSQLIKFENSGHGIFYDERDKFNEMIVDFI